MYNPESYTFFTPVGELGMPLEDMRYVMGLPPGELPYEEYIPCKDELDITKVKEPELYATYSEVMCHFLICRDVRSARHGGLSFQTRVGYLFLSEETNTKIIRPLRMVKEDTTVHDRILKSRSSFTYTLLDDEDGFHQNVEFCNFHLASTVIDQHSGLCDGLLANLVETMHGADR